MRTTGLLLLAALATCGQTLTPVWIELGANGQAIARVVVNAPADCPAVDIAGTSRPMKPRTPVPAGFKPACELAIPAGAPDAAPESRRVIAFGDTGRRILPPRVQACNDPAQWPFAQVAAAIAQAQPDLAIHVGDYNYREAECPAAQVSLCGGTPSGDNWDTWNAEFFAPAAKLLAAVPLALSRGNHEDCQRSWRGWFYLDPRPWKKSCTEFSAPYVIRMGQFELAMVDGASVNEAQLVPEQTKRFARQLRCVHTTKFTSMSANVINSTTQAPRAEWDGLDRRNRRRVRPHHSGEKRYGERRFGKWVATIQVKARKPRPRNERRRGVSLITPLSLLPGNL